MSRREMETSEYLELFQPRIHDDFEVYVCIQILFVPPNNEYHRKQKR